MSDDWLNALRHYRNLRDAGSIQISYEVIRNMIRDAADKSVPKGTLERLQFWKGLLAKRRAKRKNAVTYMKRYE
jgi:hypothetical protein